MRVPIAVSVVLAVALAHVCAWADEQAEGAAKRAYDQGAAAFEAEDYVRSARAFEQADTLAPHPVALHWALRAARLANDAVLGMRLADRAEMYPDDPKVSKAASEVREKFSSEVGAVVVACDSECAAEIDSAPVDADKRHYVLPGEHKVQLTVGDRVEDKWVTVTARASVVVRERDLFATSNLGIVIPEPDTPEFPALGEDSRGISPWWFGLGAALTAGAGAVTIWSGVDTLDRNDAYLLTRDTDGFDDGRAAQTRTNVLIGVTSGVGLATALVGIFAVDWGDEDASIEVGPSGLAVRGRF